MKHKTTAWNPTALKSEGQGELRPGGAKSDWFLFPACARRDGGGLTIGQVGHTLFYILGRV